MLRIRLSLIGFCAVLSTAIGQGWSPVLDEYHRSDFQADGLGWSAAQLPDGRLIFGFDSLVSFDGLTWRQHPIDGTYALRALAPAADGLWVGGINDVGFLAEAGGDFVYRSLAGQLPADVRDRIVDVWYAFANGPGRAVFVASEDVLEWTGSEFKVHHLPGRSRLLAFRAGGRIHIDQRPTGLGVFTDRGVTDLVAPGRPDRGGVFWMGRFGDATVAATSLGLRRIHDGRFEPVAPELDEWIREGVLTCATRLADGRLALGTLKNGVMLIEPDPLKPRPFDLTSRLPAESVHALFQDREGWLWVVSPARLLRLWPDPGVSIFQPPQPDAFPAKGLAPVPGGGTLVAADSGLWRTRPPDRAPTSELEAVAGANDRMLSVLADGERVFMGHRSGISVLGPEGDLRLVHRFGTDVFALARDADGALLAAHDRRISRLHDGRVDELAAQISDVPTSIAAAPGGGVIAGMWMQGVIAFAATSPGASQFAGLFTAERGAAFVHAVDDHVFAARGRMIAALRPDGDVARAGLLPEGFEARAVHADSSTTAWLAGERRFNDGSRVPLLHRVTLVGDRLNVSPLRLDVLNRVGAPRSLAVQSTERGPVLWIGGDEALLRVDPASLRPPTPPAAPQIRLVTATVEPGADGLLLPHRNNRLELDITSPEPGRRPDLRLETRLLGGETGWSAPRDLNSIDLANLQSGRHSLRARFVAADGSRSDVTEFSFAVAPPWWLTRWAIALEVIGGALGMLIVVRIRVRHLRRKAVTLEKLVAERTAELVHASQAKTEFVSSMSHELRNPLNGIVATAHALEDAGLDAEQRELIVTLRHCAGLLDALIGDVLDFSEIESGRIALKATEFDPVELVQAAVRVIQPVAQRKAIALRIDLEPDLPRTAVGDSSRLQQVLLNLLGNAVKFSERGEVVVRARRVTEADAEQLQFTVQDEGPGIPPSERVLLFEKFSRTSHARERGIAGTGLGLAVCRQLVERMGGRIWLEEVDAPGATFGFCVPLRHDRASAVQAPANDSGALPRTALIVEDIEYNARAMVAMLATLGCRGEAVSTAAMALQRVREKRYDVIFIDCQLPDMTGPQLAAAITAANGEAPDAPPLVATTACADEATRDACRRGGMDGFIAKPVTPEKIRAALAGRDHARLPASPMIMPRVTPGPASRLDLRQLRIIAQGPDNLQEQAQRIGGLLQADLRELGDAARRQDLAAMRSSAHRIVSHSRFIGADMLAAIADEIQQSDETGVDVAVNLFSAAEREAERVLKELASATRPLAG